MGAPFAFSTSRAVGLALVVTLAGAAALAASAALRPAPATSTDWRTVSSGGFAGAADAERARWRELKDGRAKELEALVKTLDQDPRSATRAAVLLGLVARDLEPESADVAAIVLSLEARLASRIVPPSRGETGVDLVAARVLGEVLAAGGAGPRTVQVLVELACGEAPHPDLATRVACAAAALNGASEGAVVPFLLAVLRAETPDQAISPRTWPRITTLAWVKTRAADALAKAVGTESAFRPDGSWAHQTAEARRLEELARAAGLIAR